VSLLEIVVDGDPISGTEQLRSRHTSDVAGSAGNENVHGG